MRVSDSASIASRIEQAFQTASNSTGTSFDYLVKTAMRESSLDTSAKATTSSATGLFQFVEGTWLETMKESGAELGLQQYSDQISVTQSGRYVVSDPQARQEILDLRKDPEVASLMAGALTQKNAEVLENKIGRSATDGELYMAHFLGATGASRLISAAAENGAQDADALFSSQAKANRSIFYNSDGSARSVSEVYDTLTSRHDAVTMIASAAGRETSDTEASGTSDKETFSGFSGMTSLGDKLDDATQRVVSAFEAAQSGTPFETLFRNTGSSSSTALGASFASAYSNQEETSMFTRLNASASKVVAQEIAAVTAERQGPLDLTKFMRYETDEDQTDLLPPA